MGNLKTFVGNKLKDVQKDTKCLTDNLREELMTSNRQMDQKLSDTQGKDLDNAF